MNGSTSPAICVRFVAGDQDRTTDVLRRMLETFRRDFNYRARETERTQSPGETLRTRSGTCRDYAWLMIETLRRLGIASRFVSGYLYDAALDGGEVGMTGSGSTHVRSLVKRRHRPPSGRLSRHFWQGQMPGHRFDTGALERG